MFPFEIDAANRILASATRASRVALMSSTCARKLSNDISLVVSIGCPLCSEKKEPSAIYALGGMGRLDSDTGWPDSKTRRMRGSTSFDSASLSKGILLLRLAKLAAKQ